MNRSAVEDIYPLSPTQQGMFLRSLSARDAGLYVEQTCLLLAGEIDAAGLEAAWRHAVERHAILRSAFVAEDLGEPVQVVSRRVDLPLSRYDWRGLPAFEQSRRLDEYLLADRNLGFELGRAPLIRLALIRTGDAVYHMVWTHHHLLLDGWSAVLLLNEVNSCYEASCRGQQCHLEATRSYRDFIAWLQRQDISEAEAFWRRHLAGFTRRTPLGLPAERNPPAGGELYASQKRRLPAGATARLEAAARERYLTVNTLLQGAWAILLSRYSSERDVVFGTTVSGRPAELAGVETMIGLFISTLPLRIRVRPEQRLGTWLTEIQAHHVEARRYEYCSSGQIHEWSDVPGALPLYESILVFQNYPVDAVSEPPARPDGGGGSRFVGAHSEYALTILCGVQGELVLTLVHDTRRIDDEYVSRVLDHLLELLGKMAADLDAPLAAALEWIPTGQIPRVTPLWQPTPDAGAVPPRSPTEKALAQLWTRILGVAHISVHDNFFDLRGHSLLATQLMSRVRDTFQVEVALSRLFEAPTLGQFARVIEEAILTQIEGMSEEEVLRLVDGES